MAGGVSPSELELLVFRDGLVRAIAVSRRASSRVLVGLEPRVTEFESSVENVEGSILPINVHLLLLGVLGASIVSFGTELSAVSSFGSVAREWRLLVPEEREGMIPSKPRKRFVAGDWLSFRMIRSRRPGAG